MYGGVLSGDPTTTPLLSMEDQPGEKIELPFFGAPFKKMSQHFETYVICLEGQEGIKFGDPIIDGSCSTSPLIDQVTVYAAVEWHHSFKRNKDGTYSAERPPVANLTNFTHLIPTLTPRLVAVGHTE